MFDLLKSVRFFVFQSHDMTMFPELQAGYSVAILADKLGMSLDKIKVQSVYPYRRYFQKELLPKINTYQEENYFFFLENYYHSSTYANKEIEYLLANVPYKNFYIQSAKISSIEAETMMAKYRNIKMIIRTDPEYVIKRALVDGDNLSTIPNIHYRGVMGEVITTASEDVTYELDDYIFPAYVNGKIIGDKDSAELVSSFLDPDNENTNIKVSNHRPRDIQAQVLKQQEILKTVMLTSGRGCKYKCTYCFRGIKYSTVRQISLDVVESDLKYLSENGVKRVYFYDDCFVTTNSNRLEEIVSLMLKYPFEYYIAIRYEACSPAVLETISKLTFYQVQIGLQSTKHNSSHKRTFNADKMVAAVSALNKNRKCVSIDLILGLPGEGKDDFLNSLDYAISLDPNQIIVNTLFINPGTELSAKYKTFGIKVNSNVGLNVPYIVESSTFSQQDLIDCRKILLESVDRFPSIGFVIR